MTKIKNNKIVKTNKKKAVKAVKPKTRQTPRMGAVTRVTTAPVSVGNSIQGSQPIITHNVNGVRVIGRDFCFECKATTAAVTNWALIGGMPLTPAVLVTSTIKNYAQMHNKFKINSITFYYITSSPTTQAGDIMFYYEKDRNGPFIDSTNNSFLPFVLSDPNTLIGPQWMNHQVRVTPVGEWRSTDYAVTTDLNEEAAGSVYLFSKTNSASSPGYIMMDYDISFKEMSTIPRSGMLPVTRGLYSYITLGETASVVTTGTALTPNVQGNNQDGTISALPSGAAAGDIYRFIAQVTNSTLVNAAWVNVNTTNLVLAKPNGALIPIPIDDGYTFYGLYTGTNIVIYPNLESAKTGLGYLYHGVSATVSWNMCCLASLVGNHQGFQSVY